MDNEKERNEKSLNLAKRVLDAINPDDLPTVEEKILCDVCGHANSINDGICKKCSNLLFVRRKLWKHQINIYQSRI